MKETTEMKLINQLMEHWEACAYRDSKSDFLINKLVYDFAASVGIYEENLNNDVYLTFRSLTNSQKRRLYKLMLESNIR